MELDTQPHAILTVCDAETFAQFNTRRIVRLIATSPETLASSVQAPGSRRTHSSLAEMNTARSMLEVLRAEGLLGAFEFWQTVRQFEC